MYAPYYKQTTASAVSLKTMMEEVIKTIVTCDKKGAYPSSRHSDISFFVNFIEENISIFSGDEFKAHLKQWSTNSFIIDDSARTRFISILDRMIKAHEGISREERFFVYQFWCEIGKCP